MRGDSSRWLMRIVGMLFLLALFFGLMSLERQARRMRDTDPATTTRRLPTQRVRTPASDLPVPIDGAATANTARPGASGPTGPTGVEWRNTPSAGSSGTIPRGAIW